MAKKLLRDIWDETPPRFGVWIHKTKKTIAIAKDIDGNKWSIDEGKTKNHPIFRAKFGIQAEGNGNFFFNRQLKNYEFLQELSDGFNPGEKYETRSA